MAGALLASECAPPDGVALSLAASHVFHYSLRCQSFPKAAHGWIKGPVAVTGRTLAHYGAQAVRTHDGCVTVKLPGHRYECTPPRRWYAPNASWHLSSLSGGIGGHVTKIRETYRSAVTGGVPRSTLMRHAEQATRSCSHLQGKSHVTSGVDRFERVPLRTAYPDVPRSLERLLARGEMGYMRGDAQKTRPHDDRTISVRSDTDQS
jgi:hypothetical protein